MKILRRKLTNLLNCKLNAEKTFDEIFNDLIESQDNPLNIALITENGFCLTSVIKILNNRFFSTKQFGFLKRNPSFNEYLTYLIERYQVNVDDVLDTSVVGVLYN